MTLVSPKGREDVSEVLAALIRKRDRVHRTNRRPDLPLGIKLSFGDLETLIAALSAPSTGASAREILAAAYDAQGGDWPQLARWLRTGGEIENWPAQQGVIPVRAIESALRSSGREEEKYGAGNLRFAAPGDRQDDVWLLRFDDPDRGEMFFGGPDYAPGEAERLAWKAWNRFKPTWNCYLFHVVALTPNRGEGES